MSVGLNTVYCQFCQHRIGLLRSLADREFCSSEHRKQMQARSARALRDAGYELYSMEECWNERYVEKLKKRREQPDTVKQGSLPGAAMAMACLGGIAMVAVFSGRGGGGFATLPAPKLGGAKPSFITGLINRLPSNAPNIAKTETFSAGWKNWEGANRGASGWSFDAGLIRPGDLRLWKESTDLSNYKFQFEGKIDRRGMSWAFRAPNLDNYYATKINLSGRGNMPEIVRYMVLNGKAGPKQTFPLPLSIKPSEFFKVDVKVKGQQFVTSIDGRVVDVWNNNQLRAGGVGFFNDKGELSALRWASLTEADTFVEKMKSFLYLSYIIPPPMN